MTKKFSFIKTPVGILTLLLIISLGGFTYYFMKYNDVTKDPSVIAKEKAAEAKKVTEALVKKISELMYITDASDAVSATITDTIKLKDEPFFDLAQNGDELILIPKMMKAVIYRPSEHKIINVGPFNPEAAAKASAGTPASPNLTPASTKPATTTVKSTATSTVKR